MFVDVTVYTRFGSQTFMPQLDRVFLKSFGYFCVLEGESLQRDLCRSGSHGEGRRHSDGILGCRI